MDEGLTLVKSLICCFGLNLFCPVCPNDALRLHLYISTLTFGGLAELFSKPFGNIMAPYHSPLKPFSAIFDSPEVQRRPISSCLLVITASRVTKAACSTAGQVRQLDRRPVHRAAVLRLSAAQSVGAIQVASTGVKVSISYCSVSLVLILELTEEEEMTKT